MKHLTIKNIPENFRLVVDSRDVREINNLFNTDFGGFFVSINERSYEKIYGFMGIVPYNYKTIYEIKQNEKNN